MIAINLIRILREGPEVSFIGSPTVSPTTEALCSSQCFPNIMFSSLPSLIAFFYIFPDSINFLVLSQAPPELDIEMAICTPDTKAPGNNPATKAGWKTIPTTIGVPITKMAGLIISFKEA